jgi:hypothetical protein
MLFNIKTFNKGKYLYLYLHKLIMNIKYNVDHL